jgi:hypothetical protein
VFGKFAKMANRLPTRTKPAPCRVIGHRNARRPNFAILLLTNVCPRQAIKIIIAQLIKVVLGVRVTSGINVLSAIIVKTFPRHGVIAPTLIIFGNVPMARPLKILPKNVLVARLGIKLLPLLPLLPLRLVTGGFLFFPIAVKGLPPFPPTVWFREQVA